MDLDGDPRDTRLSACFTAAEADAVEHAARRADTTMSSLIRAATLRELVGRAHRERTAERAAA